MTDVVLSLVSHTNVGKTTLARTLLGRDIGEVRDAPHVTEFADRHELLATAEPPAGDRLLLWDTPGFGDSVRLVRRLRGSANPIGWLLAEVWDRWRDRPFWASQQALRHVRAESDVLLYLINASEPEAGYLAAEMELLAWVGKPVIVLLNQLGAPRPPAAEAAELRQWRERLAAWAAVREVLPFDAFARCWVQERTLLDAVQRVLEDDEQAAAAARLATAWSARLEARFADSMQRLAAGLARIAVAREEGDDRGGLGERLRQIGASLRPRGGAEVEGADADARRRLAVALESEVRSSTGHLLELHGLGGKPGAVALEQVLMRAAGLVEAHPRLPEGPAALLGGALTGAITGLKADLATGGLTLGGGLLAGSLLGALGAAGLARGFNLMRGTGRSWVEWSPQALDALTEAALLRYLAVAHYGRGRGDWVEGEAPAHWPAVVREALTSERPALAALWRGRGDGAERQAGAERLAAALQPHLAAAARGALARLYPGPDNPGA